MNNLHQTVVLTLWCKPCYVAVSNKVTGQLALITKYKFLLWFGTWQVLILDSASSLLFSQSGLKLWLCWFLRLWWMEKESRPNPTQRNKLLSSRQKLHQSHRSRSTGSASAWTGWLGCKIWKPSLVHLMWATAAVRTKVCFNTR